MVAKVGICMMERAERLPRLLVRNEVSVVRFRELWDLKDEIFGWDCLCNQGWINKLGLQIVLKGYNLGKGRKK